MPKVSVYLPDDLYGEARARGLPISALAQRAVREALHGAQTNAWIAGVRKRRARVQKALDVRDALDAARDEFGT